jgi:hypothetical protein
MGSKNYLNPKISIAREAQNGSERGTKRRYLIKGAMRAHPGPFQMEDIQTSHPA